ncbi:MAG: tetratricopeptide repeat protein [Chloroflexi bacterium]|nr:MAG: tetratricopeptide repeat protein [Chloroflexota bacterium]
MAYQRTHSIYQRAFGDSHPKSAAILGNLAEFYRSQGRYDQAEPLFLQALSVQEHILGPEHPDTTAILNNLALLYRKQGNYPQQAFPILIKSGNLEHPNMLTLLNNYLTLLEKMGEKEIFLPKELREHYALLLQGIGCESEIKQSEDHS